MLIYIFHTAIWSCIPNKRFTCLTTVKIQDTYFPTTIMRRSIRALPHSNWCNFCIIYLLHLDKCWNLELHFSDTKPSNFWSNSLNTSSYISVRTSKQITPCLLESSRCLTSESSAFTQSERKYLFGCSFLYTFSACCPDVFLFSLLHEQYSATCMLIQPVVKPSTYTTHS